MAASVTFFKFLAFSPKLLFQLKPSLVEIVNGRYSTKLMFLFQYFNFSQIWYQKLELILENRKLQNQQWQSSCIIDRVNRHHFWREPHKVYWDQIWFHSIQWFWRRFSKRSYYSTNQKLWQPSWIWDKVIGHKYLRGWSKECHVTTKFCQIWWTSTSDGKNSLKPLFLIS